ncbi:hypothetical protein [Nocardia spumae]|uniref:hypothetical protein n=1 Tax=Nocardia spumae TaxID=2887190 RepID=UPI001D15900C|nr:hypothetical protein [Nocardia spumae]
MHARWIDGGYSIELCSCSGERTCDKHARIRALHVRPLNNSADRIAPHRSSGPRNRRRIVHRAAGADATDRSVWSGTDVLPVTYYTAGPTEDDFGYCFITWLPYKGAKSSEATDMESYSGPSYVRLSDGDVIKVEGCNWTLE